jgi:hypothetical protein
MDRPMTDTTTLKPPPDYPLLWPEGRARVARRQSSRFKTTLAGAMKNVREALTGFARDSNIPVRHMVITTNATFQNQKPADPGIAVWFHWNGSWNCFAVDQYATLAENLQAVFHVVEAKRVIMRHAGVEFIRAEMTANASTLQLPPPVSHTPAPATWWQVLDFDHRPEGAAAWNAVNRRWRELSKQAANDEAQQRRLNAARDHARDFYKDAGTY